MRLILMAFGRAMVSQLHIRMLFPILAPAVLATGLLGLLLWLFLNPMLDWMQEFFVSNDGFSTAASILVWLGLTMLKMVLVPLISMWVLLPLMIFTALLCVSLIVMPFISHYADSRYYALLERRKGGSFVGSLWISFSSLLIFALLWMISLLLSVVLPFMVMAQTLLCGWLTYRVMSYDVLADFADVEERNAILKQHRWHLLGIGTLATLLGMAPMLLWLGGAVFMLFLPLFAMIAIWLYVILFVFTGLWFQHYCLHALIEYRMEHDAAGPAELLPALEVADIPSLPASAS